MKALILLLCLFCQFSIKAQREKAWGDPHVIQKLVAAANKNPEYKKLTAQIRELSLTATRNNTNAAKVKALFSSNNQLFKNLYAGTGISAPQTVRSLRPGKTVSVSKASNFFALNKMKMIGYQEMIKTVNPPFEDSWVYQLEHSNDGGFPDSSLSNYATGLVAFKANSIPNCENNPEYNGCKLGLYLMGYNQHFTVPDNPEIIAAEISFDYEYLYTGWDTYGGITGVDMLLNVSDEMNSQSLNEIPEVFPTNPGLRGWRKIDNIYPLDSIDASFGEFHANGSSSYKVEGYVTPGSTILFRIGIGYLPGTKRGMYGCYHYGEMKLKKITVKYYKAGGQ